MHQCEKDGGRAFRLTDEVFEQHLGEIEALVRLNPDMGECMSDAEKQLKPRRTARQAERSWREKERAQEST